jgi:radical SAM superfamily enzyme YgiQ (UPF0313 family)
MNLVYKSPMYCEGLISSYVTRHPHTPLARFHFTEEERKKYSGEVSLLGEQFIEEGKDQRKE